MPRYEADPSNVTTSITILPKDEYEFVLGRPKAFERTAKAGHQSYGVRIPVTVVGGPQNGKRTIISLYLHSDGAQQMAKRFQMAVAGYTVNERNESAYDKDVAGKNWSYDTTDGSVGEAWAEYEGKHVACAVDVGFRKDEQGNAVLDNNGAEIEQQEWGTWMPIEGAAVGS